jgi:hypothetical protein
MIGGSGVAQWTTDQTCACVRQAHREVEAKFRACDVNGGMLQRMTDAAAVARILNVSTVHADVVASCITALLRGARPGKYQPHVDDFVIESRLGEGTFGNVCRAVHMQTGARYALKMFDKAHVSATGAIEYVCREQKLLVLLQEPQPCPFVVQLFFAFQSPRKMFMALTLATGGELYQKLQAMPHKRFDAETARFYIAEIMLALEWMHSKRVVHRDLKAENIVMTGDGHVLLTDLGLAKQWDQGQTDLHSTSIIGTPSYMPPEVIRESPHGVGFDFWALGVLLFEMMVGCEPFTSDDGVDAHGLFVNILTQAPCFPDDAIEALELRLPKEARALIEGLLIKNPADRLGSAKSGGWATVKAHPFFWQRLPCSRADKVHGRGGGGGGGGGDQAAALQAFDWADAAALKLKPPLAWSKVEEQGPVSDDGWEPAFQTYVSAPGELDNAAATPGIATQRAASAGAQSPSPPHDQGRNRSASSMTPEEEQDMHELELRQALLEREVSSISSQLASRERALEVVLNLAPQMTCAKEASRKYIIAPSELEGKNQLDMAQSGAGAKAMRGGISERIEHEK